MIFNPKVRLEEKHEIMPDVFHLIFSGDRIASMALPGNFVQVKVNNGLDPTFRRPMSIHSCNAGRFEMVFRVVGKGTTILARSEAGEFFDVIGPLGNTFELPEKDEIAVMISGGIGFPPLHFLSRHLMEKKNFSKEQIIYLFGIKTVSEKPMAEDILRLDVDTLFSTDDGSYGFAGPVTALFEDMYAKRLRGKKIGIYACGPTPMLHRISQIAVSFRLSCQLSLEGNMPCGIGTCLGCAVKKRGENDYLRVCHEGPVFAAIEVEL